MLYRIPQTFIILAAFAGLKRFFSRTTSKNCIHNAIEPFYNISETSVCFFKERNKKLTTCTMDVNIKDKNIIIFLGVFLKDVGLHKTIEWICWNCPLYGSWFCILQYHCDHSGAQKLVLKYWSKRNFEIRVIEKFGSNDFTNENPLNTGVTWISIWRKNYVNLRFNYLRSKRYINKINIRLLT